MNRILDATADPRIREFPGKAIASTEDAARRGQTPSEPRRARGHDHI